MGLLAAELTGRHSPIPWLRGTSALRITYALRPFEAAGWTVRDVRRQVERLDPRRWDRRTGVQAPAGLLAWFLRRVDPHSDRPGLLDEIEAERRREERQRARLAAAEARAAASAPTGEYLAARQLLAERFAERAGE